MKLNKHLQLRRIGRSYMVVDAGTGAANLTNVFTLNETAARLWQQAEQSESVTPEELAALLCEEYDVEEATAREDVRRLLEEWQSYGWLSE